MGDVLKVFEICIPHFRSRESNYQLVSEIRQQESAETPHVPGSQQFAGLGPWAELNPDNTSWNVCAAAPDSWEEKRAATN